MKIRILRTHNSTGKKDDFICDPEDFEFEMIGWNLESSDYDAEKDELIITLMDMG